MTCTSHHHACDCREQKLSVLIKAALDAAVQLDDMKNCIVVSSHSRGEDQETREKNRQTVERVYAACEALGADIEKHEVAA